MPSLSLRIQAVRAATPRSRIVRLDLDGQVLSYRAGQCVYVGAHGQPRRKPYSIASAPEETHRSGLLEFLITLDVTGRPGSHLARLVKGRAIDIEGPLGSFVVPDAPPGARYLFVAGGAGIAPLRSMLHHVLATRRPQYVGLVYSARTSREFAYRAELAKLAREGTIQLDFTVTREASRSWRGSHGRIDQQRLAPFVASPHTLCFVCGPPPLVDAVPGALEALGVPPSGIHREMW